MYTLYRRITKRAISLGAAAAVLAGLALLVTAPGARAAAAPAATVAETTPAVRAALASQTAPAAETATPVADAKAATSAPAPQPAAQLRTSLAQAPVSSSAQGKAATASAQSPDAPDPARPASAKAPVKVDMYSAVRLALANHPAVKAAADDVRAALAKVGQAAAKRKPTVKAELGYMRLDENPYFTVSGFGSMVFGEQNNEWATASLQVPLYTGGALEAMENQAKEESRASDEGLATERQKVAADAARAYWRAMTAGKFVGVMEAQVRALQESLRVAKAMHAQGIVTKLDVLRAQTALLGAQAGLVKAQNGQQVALEALRDAMGLPVGTLVELADTTQQLQVPNDIYTAREIAWADRPELRQLAAARQAALAGEKAAQAELRPQVGVELNWEPKRSTLSPEYGNWRAAIVLRQSIFDGSLAHEQAKEAKAQADKVAALTEQTRSGIAVQVADAVLGVKSARDQLKAADEAVKTGEEAYKLALLGYRNGVTPMLDVLDAQAALTKARADQAMSSHDLDIALVNAYVAMGKIPHTPAASATSAAGASNAARGSAAKSEAAAK